MTTAVPLLSPAGVTTRRPRLDAVTLLSCYLILLLIVPAWLTVPSLGSAGEPAALFAALLFFYYLLAWLASGPVLASGRQPVRAAMILFACAVLAAYVSANRVALATTVSNGADRGLISLAGWAGVLLLAADGISSVARLVSLLRCLVRCATAVAAFAVVQFCTGLNAVRLITIPGLTSLADITNVVPRDQLNRVAATTLDPIELAVVLAISLPFALYLARRARPGHRVWPWCQVAVISAALPVTISRTAVLAVVVLAAVLLPAWPRRDRLAACVAGAAALVAVSVGIPHLARAFATLITGISGDSSTLSRTAAFSSAVPFIGQHPWLGTGLGTFYPQVYFFTDDEYLLALIEIGVVGLAALLLLLATGWVSARRARRASADPEVRELAQCVAAALAVSAVCFATFDALGFPVAAGLTFLVLGCSGALLRLARAAGPPAPRDGRE